VNWAELGKYSFCHAERPPAGAKRLAGSEASALMILTKETDFKPEPAWD